MDRNIAGRTVEKDPPRCYDKVNFRRDREGKALRNWKRVLSGLMVALCLAVIFPSAAVGASYESIMINGMRYKLSNADQYYKASVVQKKAKNLNEAMAAFPEIPSYVYLINSSRTVKVKKDVTAVPKVYKLIEEYYTDSTTDYLHFDSLEQYASYFYTTDHHWNYRGSYAAYCQIIRMLLGEDEPVLEPVETVTFPVKFNGSLNQTSNAKDSEEEFTVYRFEYPEMKIEVNGKPKTALGREEAYFDGKYVKSIMANHYAYFYGGDNALVHVQTERTDRGNLLVISNSFSNAITQLLASHYHNVWIVDQRYYEISMGKLFTIPEALTEWDVDQVLILGDGDYFSGRGIY